MAKSFIPEDYDEKGQLKKVEPNDPYRFRYLTPTMMNYILETSDALTKSPLKINTMTTLIYSEKDQIIDGGSTLTFLKDKIKSLNNRSSTSLFQLSMHNRK